MTPKSDNGKFRIDGRIYRTWWDVWCDIIPLHYILTCALTSCIVFLIGFAIAYCTGIHELYLTSHPIYLGVFGIFWVSASFRWGSRRYFSVVEELQPYFAIPVEKYDHLVKEWFSRMTNNKLCLSISFVLIVLAWIGIYAVPHYPNHPIFKPFPVLFELFPAEWYHEPHLLVKGLIIDIYAIPVLLLVVSTGIPIGLNLLFMDALGRQPLVPLPEVIRGKFRALVSFNMVVSVTWSVGVVLFIILFLPRFDALSLSIVLVLSSLGILTFFLPQYSIHCNLEKMQSKIFDIYREMYMKYFKYFEPTRPKVGVITRDDVDSKLEWLDYVTTKTKPIRTWIYEPSDVVTLVVTQLVPLVVFLLRTVGLPIPNP